MKNKNTSKTDVVIIGAGPTGLMAANQLQQFGIDFIIIDTKSGPTIESRALAVSARSMELYQQLGLAEAVLSKAVSVQGFELYANGKLKADVNMQNIGSGLSDFPHMMTIFEQNKNEQILYDNLKKQGGNVHWQTKFVSLSEMDKEVEVVVEDKKGSHTIHCQYLIGCDGASSPVRRQLDFTFEGGTYENKFFVADIVLKNRFSHDKVILAPADNIFSAFFPMEGEDCYRMVGTLPKAYADIENITFEDIKESVAKSSKMNLPFDKVNWFSTYKLHHRCVDKLSKGRVFLAGDSAHIHSPAGGQGMNTGLQDAHNLCWKMAFVLKGLATTTLLDTYNEERLPFAKWLLGTTDRGFTLMSSTDRLPAIFRKYILFNFVGFATSFKRVRTNAFMMASQIWYNYQKATLSVSDSQQKLAFNAGDRLPFVKEKFFTAFRQPCFHLLHIGNQPLPEKTKNDFKKSYPFELQFVDNQIDASWQKLGVHKELFILVRPDLFIGYMADELDNIKIKAYLDKHFKLPNNVIA